MAASECNTVVKNWPKIFICGYNPFNLNENGSPVEIKLCDYVATKPASNDEPFLLEITCTHAVLAVGNRLYAQSALTMQSNEASFSSRIVQISASTWHCLVLLENGDLFKYDFGNNRSVCLEFLSAESTDSELSSTEREKITHIACGDRMSVAVTCRKAVFSIPSRIFSFPRHVRVAQVAVGLEHCLLLTSNGDVYSWGGGLRGQLGNGEITLHQELPQLVEALAGVKIVHIAAGGWHSVAVSSFGDLYSWGWNSKGQLGILDEKRQKGSVFLLPQLIEFNDEVSLEKVFCGIEHTLAIDSKNEIYFSGNNLQTRLDYTKVNTLPSLVGFKKLETDPMLDSKFIVKSAANSIIFMEKTSLDI
ncbi:uncharacterized protein LOC128734002 [Sabethes cyaneus]|uniref:uncharacterized protein LOC128734002 n=1 Tax=Sabethes cyaneus TaxID=53552 RepID=UPI00237D3ADC|nr:uncharacterized protein LOC128734002 [Sabethes cyaneus]